MLNKNWVFLNKGLLATDINYISNKFNIPSIIASIILNRLEKNDKAIDSFLNKSVKNIHHPFLLKDAKKAAGRIINAIKNNEKIVIYGDYDVDGITSCSLLYQFLKSRGARVDYYIPSRIDEGYGINILALQNIKKDGASLLITVDCGITAVGEVEFAKTIGLDIIITDHHTCKESIPRAYAVINPRQPDCSYPCKHLAGVGVAFKLMLAVALELNLNATDYFNKYIELVTIGTVADVVPLTDENRIFVNAGLKRINQTQNFGLRALISSSGLGSRSINCGAISFVLAPRINAAGRIGNAELGVKLLVSDTFEQACKIAQKLESENRERQFTEQHILKEALEIIDTNEEIQKRKVLILSGEEWHNGVIGIVSSRIVDKYYRPTIMLSVAPNGVCKGSGRSIKGFNLFDALDYCSDLLIKFGGHELAAGLGINQSDIEEFDKKINEYAKNNLPDELLTPSLNIDSPIGVSDITIKNAERLSILEPYGMGNPQPVFSLSNASLVCVRSLSNGKHCKVTVVKDGKYIDLLGFGISNLDKDMIIGSKVDVAFTMDSCIYNSKRQLQLVLKDIRHYV